LAERVSCADGFVKRFIASDFALDHLEANASQALSARAAFGQAVSEGVSAARSPAWPA
jgi:hypothetical protein